MDRWDFEDISRSFLFWASIFCASYLAFKTGVLGWAIIVFSIIAGIGYGAQILFNQFIDEDKGEASAKATPALIGLVLIVLFFLSFKVTW